MSFWPRGFSRNPRMPKLRCKSALITAVPLQSNPELTLPTCMKPYLSAPIGPCKVWAKWSMKSRTSSARPLPSRCMRTAYHLSDCQEGCIAKLLALKAMPAWISGSPAPLVFTAKHKNTSKDPGRMSVKSTNTVPSVALTGSTGLESRCFEQYEHLCM